MQPASGKNTYSSNRYGSNFTKNGPQIQPVTPLRRPSFSRGSLFPMALLASVINNPALYGEVEEDFGNLDLPENKLDRLRQAVLSTLGSDPELDAGALRSHLMGQGFEEELGRILSESIYTHASFSRPSADLGAVLVAWRAAWKAMQTQTAQDDLEQAKLALKENPSEENENRLNALREMRSISDG